MPASRNRNRFSFMFIGPDRRRLNIRNSVGFTLIEIMLAVAILGMMSVAIFRFVQSNMIALQFSSDTSAADAQYDGFRDLLTAEWQSLSPLRANMIGEPFKLGDRERDEIKWRSTAGPGLLTRCYACSRTTKKAADWILVFREKRKRILSPERHTRLGCH